MDVKITATEGPGGVEWDIDGKKPKKSVIEFKEGTGPHTIDFKLQDKTRRNLRFDTKDPFWSHETTTGDCPSGGAMSGQTGVVDCSDNRLTVTNANSGDPCSILYQLNFIDGEATPIPVDPEFKNGGAGRI
jgi:hypothetical protein